MNPSLVSSSPATLTLSLDQRARLLRSARKLGAVLGATQDVLQQELQTAKSELEHAEASSSDAIEAVRRELEEKHIDEVEKLINMNTEALEMMKTENVNARKELEELSTAHTKSLEDKMAEYKNQHSTYEAQLAEQSAANTGLNASLSAAQEALTKAEEEIQQISQQLAHEKMERMTTKCKSSTSASDGEGVIIAILCLASC